MASLVMSVLKIALPTTFALALVAGVAITACKSSSSQETISYEEYQYLRSATASAEPSAVTLPASPAKSPKSLLREVRLYKDLIPRGVHARKYKRRMNPRYITVHSTQNYSAGADAWKHSLALKNGKLRATKRVGGNRIGYLVWHYSIDENVAVQHLPTNEQGEHADFDGPGNNYSIGIEMCEHKGNSRSATLDRTAKLIAYLMYEEKIPIYNVVPHYHWERTGLSKPHKNCPHYLLDNGRPGAKWKAFQAKVQGYYDQITKPSYSTASNYSSPSSSSGYSYGY